MPILVIMVDRVIIIMHRVITTIIIADGELPQLQSELRQSFAISWHHHQ